VARGAIAHRGPKTIFSGERLCQLRDPFGNLLGLRQPPQRGPVGAAGRSAAGGRG
jgi:hypothetical protein